ncbi:hypothetical protein TVAG_290880 [Trichomonas vaginalis G3]|uniref:Uncharacterized protein n=1 Tax=Trichomonas vaginalis (strain ATCC PRA-98 / G3) TaxID=412133 RepID=A2F3W6_TRIV3|nr:hypothetical protein TVAGG3_0307460 [Trichomonas vaginalis G3]EAY00382.1 hypothetical protein TVAG_290880 [Trichomonas vaginalis G3]KAI5528351.1 hypothetical protein TVAGG3_0307460 [Trichomonas vaginalis G3]|eukprot:XP_001313311.1 hypothetical protein [Trichomonas vaginalis G3]
MNVYKTDSIIDNEPKDINVLEEHDIEQWKSIIDQICELKQNDGLTDEERADINLQKQADNIRFGKIVPLIETIIVWFDAKEPDLNVLIDSPLFTVMKECIMQERSKDLTKVSLEFMSKVIDRHPELVPQLTLSNFFYTITVLLTFREHKKDEYSKYFIKQGLFLLHTGCAKSHEFCLQALSFNLLSTIYDIICWVLTDSMQIGITSYEIEVLKEAFEFFVNVEYWIQGTPMTPLSFPRDQKIDLAETFWLSTDYPQLAGFGLRAIYRLTALSQEYFEIFNSQKIYLEIWNKFTQKLFIDEMSYISFFKLMQVMLQNDCMFPTVNEFINPDPIWQCILERFGFSGSEKSCLIEAFQVLQLLYNLDSTPPPNLKDCIGSCQALMENADFSMITEIISVELIIFSRRTASEILPYTDHIYEIITNMDSAYPKGISEALVVIEKLSPSLSKNEKFAEVAKEFLDDVADLDAFCDKATTILEEYYSEE